VDVGKIGVEDNKSVAPQPAADPKRATSKGGSSLRVVVPGSADLVMTFDSEHLRDTAAKQIQNGCKRGAVMNGQAVKSNEGHFYFVNVAYVQIDR
jgi:hypothetical protein